MGNPHKHKDRQDQVYISFWTKEMGVGPGASKGRKAIHRKNRVNVW